ncbi:MAG: energy-coupling factor ABC transporter permease [Gammaproteobacteria bacterium]
MTISSGILAGVWIDLSWYLFALLTVLALIRAPWFRLVESDSSNIYFASIVILLVLWQIRASIIPGQEFHFLGVGAATLMFGWEFAFLAVQILLVTGIVLSGSSWDSFAMNSLLLGAIPAGLTHVSLRLSQRFLPHNFFIYIFLNAFIISGLGIMLTGTVLYYLLMHSHAPLSQQMQSDYLIVLLMTAIPEGTINGMTITSLIVYKPQWVTTFRDNIYLSKK